MTAHSTNAPALGLLRVGKLYSLISDMYALRRQRRELSTLDDRALMDIGLTRQQAQTEAARPAWDVPSHWLR